MFSILPLQLATNVFLAETAEDLDRFYGLDKIPQQKSKTPTSSAIYSINCQLPPELSPRCTTSLVELDVTDENGALTIKKIPPSSQEIILYERSDQAKPLLPGQICIISPNNGFPKAFYKPIEQDVNTI